MRMFISFDLHDAGDDEYTALYDYFKEIGAIEASESFYVIKDTTLTAEEIRDEIIKRTDSKATVIVGPMENGVCTKNAQNIGKWLNK